MLFIVVHMVCRLQGTDDSPFKRSGVRAGHIVAAGIQPVSNAPGRAYQVGCAGKGGALFNHGLNDAELL